VRVREKLQQLQRIERLRRRLHEMSAWQLARVQWEREKLAANHAEMIEALSEGFMSYGPLSMAGTRRVRSIEREIAIAAAIERDMEKRALEDGRLAKLADRRLAAVREVWREAGERRSLEDLIEATIAVVSASRKP
jgi:hypothetical protein